MFFAIRARNLGENMHELITDEAVSVNSAAEDLFVQLFCEAFGGQVGFTKMDAAQIRRIKAAAFSPS